MLKFTCSFGLAWLGLCMAPLTAAVVFEDNFESYADTAALTAVWTGNGNLSLSNSGNPGKSASNSGVATTNPTNSNVNVVNFGPFNPTATEHLRLTGQMFDDGTSSNERMSIGLRHDSGPNIIEMGFYNSPVYYAARVISFQSGNPNWVVFPNLAAPPALLTTPVAGWHTFTVEISNDTVDFTLDLGSDGTIDSTQSFNSVATAAGFNQVRIGGPSGFSSPGGPASFDNIRLETIAVPEPTSAGLCVLLGGMFMIRRRRR